MGSHSPAADNDISRLSGFTFDDRRAVRTISFFSESAEKVVQNRKKEKSGAGVKRDRS
jgi:hypothetical protein